MTVSKLHGASLGVRQLNRALLKRQLLLERVPMGAAEALEHLVGIQSQQPQSGYVGLWTRLDGFDPLELSELIERRKAVRISLMRSTIHLVTARDCLRLRPVVQEVNERWLATSYKTLAGIDRAALEGSARELLAERPMIFSELGKRLAERFHGHDPHGLAMAARGWLALVQPPPRGLWRRSGQAVHTTVESWLGKDMRKPDLRSVVRRYLRAFGPATKADFRTWSGVSGSVMDEMRDLRRFAGGLYDVEDGPLPDPDTPAPVRFVPEYDNVLLSHADRERVIRRGYRERVFIRGGILVDGFCVGAWRAPKNKLEIELFKRVPKAERAELDAEADRLREFLGS